MSGIHIEDIEGCGGVFFPPWASQAPDDHAKLNPWLDKAVQRYAERSTTDHSADECEELRGRLIAFRNLYAFLSQVIPYGDSDLEKLSTFVRFLIPKLPRRAGDPRYHFDDEVSLRCYRLQKISEGQTKLQQAATANPLDAFKLVFDKALEGLFIGRMEQNESLTARFLDDTELRRAVSRYLMTQVYEQTRGEAPAT